MQRPCLRSKCPTGITPPSRTFRNGSLGHHWTGHSGRITDSPLRLGSNRKAALIRPFRHLPSRGVQRVAPRSAAAWLMPTIWPLLKGRASIQLKLTDITRDGGNTAISTKTFSAVAEPTKKRDAAIIGGGAGLGAAIGAIAGGGKGAAIGAAVGGGAGTGTVLATKGKEIHYGPETRLTFMLAQPVEI